jgi:hypothetical protein
MFGDEREVVVAPDDDHDRDRPPRLWQRSSHRSLDMTLRYAKIASRTVAGEYFAVSEEVEALYGQPCPARETRVRSRSTEISLPCPKNVRVYLNGGRTRIMPASNALF